MRSGGGETFLGKSAAAAAALASVCVGEAVKFVCQLSHSAHAPTAAATS